MFIRQLIRLNAAFLIDLLQKFVPGSPAIAILLFHDERTVVMASITVSDTEAPRSASVAFLDAHGHPTTADDVPAWVSSDEAVATVAASEDGLSGTVTFVAPGVALIDVTTTNDDGTTASAQGTVTVQPGDAVIGEVTFGDGEPEPTP